MGITLIEQIASIINNVLVDATLSKLGGLCVLSSKDIVIKETKTQNEVVYTISGDVGNKINNPDIKIKYNETFTSNDSINLEELNKLVFNNYITSRLLLTYSNKEVK